ncbi:MAG: SDR family NAD(P)-dependent oxidoreductase [Leptolyngbya sp. SIO3F4]|nr:SDR family NAD(P)-dependent oxidoreductase [Leptolyngbya sp. SIO3F4]
MKRHFFITGTSSGIGHALVRHILAEDIGTVTGIARRAVDIHDDRYTHVQGDLSDPAFVNGWQFEVPTETTHVYLVNNAGTIGDIHRQGEADPEAIAQLFYLNLTSPAILINRFIGSVPSDKQGIILNISSGAAQYAIDAWAPYCGSKAGLDHFSRVVATELSITQKDVRIFSVAPGIVDTEMQGVIRASDPNQFSRHGDFVSMKHSGELVSSETVAQRLAHVLTHPDAYLETVFSLRDISE